MCPPEWKWIPGWVSWLIDGEQRRQASREDLSVRDTLCRGRRGYRSKRGDRCRPANRSAAFIATKPGNPTHCVVDRSRNCCSQSVQQARPLTGPLPYRGRRPSFHRPEYLDVLFGDIEPDSATVGHMPARIFSCLVPVRIFFRQVVRPCTHESAVRSGDARRRSCRCRSSFLRHTRRRQRPFRKHQGRPIRHRWAG